ncbi:putative oxidoreductase YcjS [Botrimarina colliarenosi]|uniref:Putative oxidoreductase YcjS n=1 Tax=Botrimarina colliarenosi TaxID=2528001 RepID=A0A5C6ADD1_9BACT|nr:Gfo/Idh/MocA family oxidoreductase [Botrimarina colliarenosi]TWT97609.1 putative oxidoreductase YcjS [Botrimarina colliarenosi]
MLRAAVIGAGHIAKQHLAAIDAAPGVEAVGVCDLSAALAELTAERFGVTAWETDFRRLLADCRPDAVHITTPAATHLAIAKECLEAGSHVFVEKPIATSLEDLERLAAVAESSGRWLVEDHNYLFNDDVQQLLRLHREGRFGDVLHVEVQVDLPLFAPGSRFVDRHAPHPAMREPLGAVSDFLTHLSYLANAFVGPIRSASCQCRRDSPVATGAISEFKALVDAAFGTALLGVSTGGEIDRFRIRVDGSRLSAEVNLFEVGAILTRTRGGPKPLIPIRNMVGRGFSELRNARRSLSRKLSGGPGPYEGLWRLVAEFYARCDRGEAPPVSLDAIREVGRWVDVITHAACDNATVSERQPEAVGP